MPLCLLLAPLQTPHVAQSPLSADVCRHLGSSAAAAPSKGSCLFHDFHISAALWVKNQHLSKLNERRRLEWSTSMLYRLGEAKKPHSRTCPARHTHFSTCPRPFSALFEAIFTPFFCCTVSLISIAVFFFLRVPFVSLCPLVGSCFGHGFNLFH